MKYSNLLNLGQIFKDAPTYVIMRRSPDFPNYYRGQDIDILCASMEDMTNHIIHQILNLTQYFISADHIQLDHYQDGFDLKFDIYSHHISAKLTNEILATRFPMRIQGETFSYPQPEMDEILKCYEWMTNGKEKYRSYGRHVEKLREYET